MEFDTAASVFEEVDRPPCKFQIDEPKSLPGIAGPGSEGLENIVEHLAARCDARAVLVLWHPFGARPETLCSLRLETTHSSDFDACRAHAMVVIADVPRAPTGSGSLRTEVCDAFLTGMVPLESGIITITSLLKEPDARSTERCRLCLEGMLPLVKPFFEQWLATQRALARMQSMRWAIELSDMAIIMLGGGAEIVYANAAAERILAEQDGLRRNGERLACRSLSQTLRLHAAIDYFNEEVSCEKGLNPVLALAREDRRPLTIALTTAKPRRGAVPDEVRAIAYVFDPEQDLTGIVEPACRLYSLSHRETKLTCALIDGFSLSAAANRLGLQEQTARSYLKQIFAKTETKRQAELVQLMLKSAIRIASEGRTQTFA